jgi:polysaccharide export outer membrane protein
VQAVFMNMMSHRKMMVRSRAAIGGAVVLTCLLAAIKPQALGQAPGPSGVKTSSPAPKFQERYPRYQLRPGDVFTLRFEFTPEFDQTVTVLPDGYVNLREVGDLHVAGKTVSQLSDAVRQAYGKILNSPSIVVSLTDFEKPYFVAGGQIHKPGKYELRDDTTVIEGIAIAGGLTDAAKHSQVLLFRKVSSDWMEAKVLNVKDMLNKKNLDEDLHLKPGDMIIVPQSKISKIQRFIPASSIGFGINY